MNIILFEKNIKIKPERASPGSIFADLDRKRFYEVGKNNELRRIKDLKKIELIKSEINGQNQHS